MGLRRPALLVPAAIIGVVLVVVLGLWIGQRGRALPNTSVAGVDVGGSSADEIADRIGPVVDDRLGDPVVFTFEDHTFELVPAELGYSIDVDATVEAALSRGRSNPVADVGVRLASFWRERDVDLVEDVDRDAIAATVDDIAAEVDRDRTSGSVTADPETLEVTIEEPRGPVEVRRDEAVVALETAIRSPGPDRLELPADVEEPAIDPADVRQVAEQVEAAIAEPLVLRVDDESLTLDPRQLAALIEVVETDDGTGLELQVTEDRVEEQLAPTASDRFDVAPVDASFTTPRTPPVTFDASSSTTWSPVELEGVEIIPGEDGRRFVSAIAAEQLTEALRADEQEVALDVEVTEPELTTAEAEELAPTHVVSTFTTYYEAGQTRVANIQRLADVVDGTQTAPGAQFSINGISGERTCAKGYQPAGTILRGELVDTCGGGVSQFGTTTFNAAFFSGFPLDQWKAHSFYISRYPRGREATLSYPQLDVVFTNTSDAPIVVRTSHTSTSVTVSIYGRPIASKVTASHGEPYDFVPPTTSTRETDELPEGETQMAQEEGGPGFKIRVVRRVHRLDGGIDERTINTTYQPVNGIEEVGTG
jgi:vancomycin resistance protein YoaR